MTTKQNMTRFARVYIGHLAENAELNVLAVFNLAQILAPLKNTCVKTLLFNITLTSNDARGILALVCLIRFLMSWDSPVRMRF